MIILFLYPKDIKYMFTNQQKLYIKEFNLMTVS